MSSLDLTEAVDAAARAWAESFTRRALIPTAWDDLPERVKLGWREEVLPLVTAAAPFIAAQAAESERERWVSTVERLALGAHARSESGRALLDLLALDERRGVE